ncbi:MAG: response regulator transcription factor [Microscillaceae bacterium]|jgi:DNA-binding NarL/FixJ family response regulator|nr:response regulator transcription factor [Microscillaceae bacterium]
MEKIKLITVDDHKIVRDGLRAMLLGNREIEIIAEASNPNSLLEILKTQLPDVLVLDIKLGGATSGIDLAKMLRQTYPKLKILMLTANVDENYIIASLKAGAKGFLSKDCSKEEFLKAVMKVYRGEVYFGENISQAVIQSYVRQIQENISDIDKPLSDRELEIVKLLCEGLTTKQIGDELCISSRTVESHKTNILEKLGLQNTVELVKYAIKNKIVEL